VETIKLPGSSRLLSAAHPVRLLRPYYIGTRDFNPTPNV
jgi:hypothetical protein